MPATAENIRELHSLHQRAKAIRDRLTSAPKTLANRQAVLVTRQAAVEAARKALKEAKGHVKNREIQLQGQQAKSDDLRAKLNQVKKQDEYNAIVSQLALDKRNMEKVEHEILEDMEKIDLLTAELATMEADAKKLADEVAALAKDIAAKADEQASQLKALDVAIAEAEEIIPEDQREQYRRNVKQRGADALAAADDSACTGCYTSVTPQMENELINGHHLVFCKTCGRILYLPDHDHPNTKRSAS